MSTISRKPTRPQTFIYEMEKGWSFDGYYIPHFVELNWYFGGDPFDYHGIQKIRIHGLSRGRAKLQVMTNGMETDYIADYSSPEYIDLPNTPIYIADKFFPVTNYADAANRGISVQMKFEGRNLDITQPEPSHVIQVLAVQSSPQGTGKRAN